VKAVVVAARNKESKMTMKANCEISKWVGRCCAGLVVAGLVLLPGSLAAQEKGATKLIQLKPIKTAEDAATVEAGDMVAMSCPKCKDTWVTVVEKQTKTGAKPDAITVLRHECPGCEHQYVTQGHGKAKTEKLVHVCKHCGSKDAFCCVMKKGDGPTPGMEKDKK
jgi:hypothetical protein